MSLKTWKEEFYPCEATSDEAKANPINHSLRKWIGLREENLYRHEVHLTGRTLYDDDATFGSVPLPISDSSCALCVLYNNGLIFCKGCPLNSEDIPDTEGCQKEYIPFLRTGNPEPMIKALENALTGQSTVRD